MEKVAQIKASIICEESHLPFKDNCFEEVISHHTIEHMKNPFEFLKELIRVSTAYVNIRCPHRFSLGAKIPQHISYFDKKWFYKACRLLGAEVRIDMSFSMFKLKYLVIPFFVRPRELIIKIYKG